MDDFMVQLHEEQDRHLRVELAMIAEGELAEARTELERCTWREPVRFVQAHRAVQEAETARAEAEVPAEELHALADRIIQLRLVSLRGPEGRYATHRHPLHPEVDAYFDQLAADVAAEVAAIAAQPGGLPPTAGGASELAHRRANELPELLELLSASAVHATLTQMRDKMRAVAADRNVIAVPGEDGRLVVQHVASGLRARFELEDAHLGTGRFGTIYAKHYNIPSIDPSGAERRPDAFQGLGIGELIYRRGAAEYPDVRWRSGSYTPAAAGLRRRLHAEDPYIWDVRCTVCTQHFQDDQDWRQHAREDFPPH